MDLAETYIEFMNESLDKFNKGLRVIYIPSHANGDRNHPHCQHGVVSSVNDRFVFVKYDTSERRMTTGNEPYTAAATNPWDLVIENELIRWIENVT